jgi:hypothetical protein
LLLQIAGGQRYRPPAVDVNAPDLFIPLMGLWSYALISCVVLAFKHAFKPEMMSSTVRQQQSPWAPPLAVQYSALGLIPIVLSVLANFWPCLALDHTQEGPQKVTSSTLSSTLNATQSC